MKDSRRVMTTSDLAGSALWDRGDSLAARDALEGFTAAVEGEGVARVLVTNGTRRSLVVDPERAGDALDRAAAAGLLVESTSRLAATVHASPTSRLDMVLACVQGVDVASAVARVLVELAHVEGADRVHKDRVCAQDAAPVALRSVAGVGLDGGRLTVTPAVPADVDAWPHLGVVHELLTKVPAVLVPGVFAEPLAPSGSPLADTLARLLLDETDWRVAVRNDSPLPLRSVVPPACLHVRLLATAVALESDSLSRVRLPAAPTDGLTPGSRGR